MEEEVGLNLAAFRGEILGTRAELWPLGERCQPGVKASWLASFLILMLPPCVTSGKA